MTALDQPVEGFLELRLVPADAPLNVRLRRVAPLLGPLRAQVADLPHGAGEPLLLCRRRGRRGDAPALRVRPAVEGELRRPLAPLVRAVPVLRTLQDQR